MVRRLERRFGVVHLTRSEDPDGVVGRLRLYFGRQLEALTRWQSIRGLFQNQCGSRCRIRAGETVVRPPGSRSGRPSAVRAVGAANGATGAVGLALPPGDRRRRSPRLRGLHRKEWLLRHERPLRGRAPGSSPRPGLRGPFSRARGKGAGGPPCSFRGLWNDPEEPDHGSRPPQCRRSARSASALVPLAAPALWDYDWRDLSWAREELISAAYWPRRLGAGAFAADRLGPAIADWLLGREGRDPRARSARFPTPMGAIRLPKRRVDWSGVGVATAADPGRSEPGVEDPIATCCSPRFFDDADRERTPRSSRAHPGPGSGRLPPPGRPDQAATGFRMLPS